MVTPLELLKDAIILYLQQGNTNIGNFDLQPFFGFTKKYDMKHFYIVPVIEEFITEMKSDRLKVLKRKRKTAD